MLIKKDIDSISLVGFSMGGSMTLKYLGENELNINPAIQSAAVFSVPCHLGSSARELDKPSNWFYRKRFLDKLHKKILEKEKRFPELITAKHFEKIRTFEDFDNAYTSPLHGFQNAQDFYSKASSGQFIPAIRIPTLIVNAINDPFLPKECYPIEVAKKHQHVSLEMPDHGGHVGFSLSKKEENWMEVRAFEFISTH
jgi:Predicted hydrolase of the alpha/beta-hydrolase fold